MKAWQWVALALGGIVVIVLIEKMTAPKTATPSTSLFSASGLGAAIAGAFSKIGAPSGNPAFNINGGAGSAGTPPGYTGSEGYTPATAAAYGSQYSAAMASTAETAAATAGSGGTTFNGGLATGSGGADPLGIGSLSNPGFNTGTMGVDFMS